MLLSLPCPQQWPHPPLPAQSRGCGGEIMPSRGVKHLEWHPGNYRSSALRCTAPSCSFRSAGIEGFTSARTAIKKKIIRQMVHSGTSAASSLCSLSLPRERLPRKLESKLHPHKILTGCPLGTLGTGVNDTWTQQSWSAVLEGHC